MTKTDTFLLIATTFILSGCTHPISNPDYFVTDFSSDQYISYATQPTDLSIYSKYSQCANPSVVAIINNINPQDHKNFNLLTEHVRRYMVDALNKSNVRIESSSNRKIGLALTKFGSEPGFSRTAIFEMTVSIPDISLNKTYSIQEYSGDFVKAIANAIHVLTWKIISDPDIIDYITCTDSGIRNSTKVQLTPLDVLNRRYVSGEITKEQYDRMRSDIQH